MPGRVAEILATAAAARRFLAAIVISLLLHVLAISGAWLRPPEFSPPPPRLEARLASMSPPAVKPAAPRPQTAPQSKSPTRPTPRPPPRPVAPPEPPLPATAAAAPFAAPPEEAAPVAPAHESAATPEPQPAQQTANTPPRSLPKKGRITYTLFLGTDKFSVGRTVQSWEIEGDRYKLGSVSETTGIVNLFHPQHLNYLSEGRITASGLRPDTFLMSRKRRGEIEAAKASFDWENAQITLGRIQQRRSEALPAGSLDMVSLFYQLSLAPPAPGRLRLPVTNGSDLDFHELDVLEPENIETPLGALKALPVRQVRLPGKESIEFWLAADYGYLPVRIRFIGREGEVSGEQLVNEIRIAEE